MTVKTAIINPRKRLPASPIKIEAGWILKHEKAKLAPRMTKRKQAMKAYFLPTYVCHIWYKANGTREKIRGNMIL